MPMYYNENGDLQEYARWTQLAKCKKCGKPYRQECEEQVPGFRDRDYDICPYCGHENKDDAIVCKQCFAGFPKEKHEITEKPERESAPRRKTRS